MDHRIVWVHGIGTHGPGFSTEWERNLNRYLNLGHEAYVEVVWDDVFAATRGVRGPQAAEVEIDLTPQEELAEAEVREDLKSLMLARASALSEAERAPAARGASDGIVEWSQLEQEATARGLGLPPLWSTLDASLGDFTKYLVSSRLRNAVQEKFKAKMRPLAEGAYSISVISHSWGTVVAYDSLLELETEVPSLRTVHLMTLGSPLWMVRRLLEDRTGRKPGRVGLWTNIHARGDVVGSWLNQGFRVDKEYEVPSHGNVNPHSSYFVEGNEAVLRNLLARTIQS